MMEPPTELLRTLARERHPSLADPLVRDPRLTETRSAVLRAVVRLFAPLARRRRSAGDRSSRAGARAARSERSARG